MERQKILTSNFAHGLVVKNTKQKKMKKWLKRGVDLVYFSKFETL